MAIYENPTDYTQDPYTSQQLTTAANAAGIDPATLQQEYQQNYQPAPAASTSSAPAGGGGGSAQAAVQNPSWIYAVNMPSTYPDLAAMKAAGAGLVIPSDSANLGLLIDAARQWGVPFAIQVAAAPGVTPQQYAAQVAQAQAYGPSKLVLDMEQPAKGYEGSTGWDWAQQTADLLKPIVQGTSVAVSMEPNQADYNYGAFKNLSGSTTDFWVQSYTGDMTAVDAQYATAPAKAAGAGNVVAVLAPGVKPSTNYTGGYVSYGIPTTGASAAGVYGSGGTQTPGLTPNPPNTTTTTSPGGGPGHVGDIPATGPTSPGSPVPPIGAPSATGPASTQAQDYATAYFGSMGLPPDVIAQVSSIFAKYPDNPQLAVQLAQQYVRTTPWFGQTFPGFFNGLRNGLYTDESGYRQYVNQANVYTQQYFGRPITTGEIESALTQGLTPEILGRTYDANAISLASGQDWMYTLGAFGDRDIQGTAQGQPGFNPQDLATSNDARGATVNALSRQQAGLTNQYGARLQAALDRANKRMQAVFGGQLATPNTAGQALSPTSRPDIGA